MRRYGSSVPMTIVPPLRLSDSVEASFRNRDSAGKTGVDECKLALYIRADQATRVARASHPRLLPCDCAPLTWRGTRARRLKSLDTDIADLFSRRSGQDITVPLTKVSNSL